MRRQGFTLVELSIVLVVIGLITGGILSGRSLIRGAEVRSITADAEHYKGAVFRFRDAYNAWPGDFYNATGVWTGIVTDNGNGDGYITYSGGGLGEEYLAWEHMVLAKILDGRFDGQQVLNIPNGKITNTFYRISYQPSVYGEMGHMISVNGWGGGGAANAAFISPNEMRALDVKVDDGLADSGKVMGFNQQGVGGCATANHTTAAGTYILPSDLIRCKMFYVIESSPLLN